MKMATKDVMAMIKQMSPRDRKALVHRMIRSGLLEEEKEDALLAETRKHEPTTPAEDFFGKLAEKRASSE